MLIFVEGRYPNQIVAAQIAAVTAEKAKHILGLSLWRLEWFTEAVEGELRWEYFVTI